jgi:cysteinyl-tRNA synthetase
VFILFNSLSRSTEPFEPADGKTALIYTCGPTVYDVAHIGNFRTFVFTDVLCRYLRRRGWETRQVMNLTDVDDKTIRGAASAGMALRDYTEKYTRLFFEDIGTLRIEPAWMYPRATDNIPQMQQFIQGLIDRGHAYKAEDGSVYFDIRSFGGYGKLSGVQPDSEARSAEYGRLSADEYERESAQDFALWKAAKEGEPSWESPWGSGRPGWHIECSTMALEYLGETIDIHSGGVDLLFPHHENEVAQSEALTGKPFARFWVHPEHLFVEGRKMAKSLGNFYTLRDLLDKGYEPAVLRHQFLSVHYRRQLNFTFEGLDQSAQIVKRLWDFMDRLAETPDASGESNAVSEAVAKAQTEFDAALDNDLNIPGAIAAVQHMTQEINPALIAAELGPGNKAEVAGFLEGADSVLGFLAHEKGSLDAQVEAMIEARAEAKRNRDYARADEIRKQLADQGIVLEDSPTGTRWRRM